MFLTLVLVPVVYELFEKVQLRVKALLARRAREEQAGLGDEILGK
jgi:hypothetical protein